MDNLLFKLFKKKKLTKANISIVPKSYEIIGDILIFSDFPKELKNKEKMIAEAYIAKYKNIKVVTKKIKKFSGRYRLPKLKILAGEKRKDTLHVENGIKLKINPEKAYFSSKRGSERLRIAKQVKRNETILVMFSGVAPFSLTISKYSEAKEIHGIEINKDAHALGIENVYLNKIKNIFLHKGNVKIIIPKFNKKFDTPMSIW